MLSDRVTETGPGRRKSRNRKKSEPLWQRVPEPSMLGRALVRLARRSLPYLIALGAMGALAGASWLAYWWATTSPRFAVEAVEVRTGGRVADERVREHLGDAVGENIFLLDRARLETRLEGDPWVARAVVRRRLPDRLVVDVTEHQPAALVELGGLYLADRAGRVFKRAFVAAGEGLSEDGSVPIITGIDRNAYNDDPAGTEDRIRAALDALERYHERDERPRVGEVHLDPRRGLTFVTLEAGISIRVGVGDADALAPRLASFDAAWRALEPEERAAARIIYADNVTRPDRVTVAFADQEP